MILKKISTMLLVSCMLFSAAGCGTAASNGSGSGEISNETPTLKQIYAANTLEQYEAAHIQPSFSSCLREGKENKESNSLMTLYFDDELGLVCRFRKTETGLNFRYYFNKDNVDYYASAVVDENGENEEITLTIQKNDLADSESDDTSYVEKLFRQYSFGEYNGKEKIISCTDCGETYHIVTDISYASFTDNSGGTYEYTTQEYDVEKKTLRILDTFRTYTFTNRGGESKTCTLSRSLTYGEQIISMPSFMTDKIRDADWSRSFTIRSYDKTETIAVPDGVSVLVDVPDDYDVYTDSSQKEIYSVDLPDDDGSYPDCSVYIGEK
ncbi:MAG: hypothetical protein LUE11_00025 [Clostridia bacterium]|nr:hypothetical protein [Clostridia bacterium]